MPARRADYSTRRFLDEFPSVHPSRFRALGIIDPAKRQAVIPFPNGKQKLIGTVHFKFPTGGGWSFFRCPKCDRRTARLYLVDDAPRCRKCCQAMNIQYRCEYGFGRAQRRAACDRKLDRDIAKLETKTPLMLKPAPPAWGGRSRFVQNSRKLAERVRRRMIQLRLDQIAAQQASERAQDDDVIQTYQPLQIAKDLNIDLKPIWQAKTQQDLEIALDHAQDAIIKALTSDDHQQRINAAKLLLRTKQARDRGLAA